MKIKNIALLIFLVDALLLAINIKYRDQVVSVVPDLFPSKLFFFLGTLSFIVYIIFIVYLKRIKSKELLNFTVIVAILSLSLSFFFNLRLAKNNYDRIHCEKGISEYFQYFENDCGPKIEKKFKEDLLRGEIKYFQNKYNSDLEYEEMLRGKFNVDLISSNCTRFTSMDCYNELVKTYIEKKEH